MLKEQIGQWFCIFLAGFLMTNKPCLAQAKPRSLSLDNRIKQVVFQENNVVPVTATTFNTTQLVFGKNEAILAVENGDLDAWTVDIQSAIPNMLFLKPTVVDSNTNMTVITNKHTYYFQLNSVDITKKKPKLTYAIHFSYPAELKKALAKKIEKVRRQRKALLNQPRRPKDYHWDYSFHGDKAILPLSVYDDGRFTYFELRPNQIVPAIFSVDDKKGNEAVVNTQIEGDTIIVKRIAPQFTLRNGPYHVASIFNEPLIKKNKIRGSS